MPEEMKRGSNPRQEAIGLKRSIMTNPALPAAERLRAGRQYLTLVKVNRDNTPVVKRLIEEFQDSNDPEVRERALKLKRRLMDLLDLKDVGNLPMGDYDIDDEPIAIAGPAAIFPTTEAAPAADPWDGPSPLPLAECWRILDVDKPFEVFQCGEFILRPGADIQKMISAALGDRPCTITTLQKLYRHLTESFAHGGMSLTGPLSAALRDILTAHIALLKSNVESVYDRHEGQQKENQ